MYSARSTQRTHIRQTQRDVDVTQRELERFRELNQDDAQIRDAAQMVKITNAELRDFPNDITLILHAKSQQLASIKRNVHTVTSVGNTIGLLTMGGTSSIVGWLNLVRENNTDLARMILPYFQPSLALSQDREGTEDKVIVMSNARTTDISGILQKFYVPECIAVDIQEIYQKGPRAENITSVISHLFTKFAKKKDKPDSSGFDF